MATASPDYTPRLTARERAIASLAFRNLEASIGLRNEVAALRRRLTHGGIS
jgi:hypothetical protein